MTAADDGDRLIVVLKGYPRLSETFIAQELAELEARGRNLDIWSLRHPYDDRTHPIHDQIAARLFYLPEYLYQEPIRVARGLFAALRRPGFRRALTVWLKDLRRDLTPNRVRRFGQALVLAREIPARSRLFYAHFLHTPASVTRYAAILTGADWAVSAHAKDIWTSPDWEVAEKLAEARFCATCTYSGAEQLRRLAPAPDRVALIYHGLDLRRFPPPPADRSRKGPFSLISVGRAVAKKGYDDLIEALTRLPADLDWRLTHIGGGALSQQLMERASNAGVADRIDWLGKQDQTEVVARMRQADLFILPSKIADDGDRDGLPNVLMEAASQKLPILSTNVSAIPEFITSGVHGVLTPPADPAALSEAIVALAGDEQGRMRMAEAAFDRLTSDFGMMAGIDRLEGLLAPRKEGEPSP